MFTLAIALLAAPVPALSVGFADVDVTPVLGSKPVFLAGFGQNRQATKIHDPISARAVVLSDGSKKIALVSVDVIGLFLPVIERVRTALPGFDYVLVSSTHNHEGPDTLGLWGRSPFQSGVDPEYTTKLEAGIVAAVKKADTSRAATTATLGVAAGPELLHDGRKPIVLHDELVAVRFGSGEKPVGIIVQWNCHPETMDSKNTEVTADYIHYTVKHLQQKHHCPVVYFTGTVGGLLTSLKVDIKNDAGVALNDGTWEKTERFGVKVGELADQALAAAQPVNLTPFTLRTKPVHIPVENGLYRLAWQSKVVQRSMYVWDGDPHPKAPKEASDPTKPVSVKSEVGYLSLGDLDVAAIPGEIYPELVLGKVQDPVDPGADFPNAAIEPAIYAQMRGKHKMLIGLANDELGYFIPKRQWDEQPPYCYGLKKSQYGEMNSVGPEAAPLLCETFRALAAGK